MTTPLTALDKLPAYVYGDCCKEKHYLSLNRDITGKWSIGYVEFAEHTAIGGLALNDADTIEEAAVRMEHALERFKKK